jgi:hypothetical protein
VFVTDGTKKCQSWLAGYVAFDWDAMDAWFDEDEETGAHPRDPYARIDVRRTSRPVEVSVCGEVVTETRRALVLSEGHLPNRFYVPRGDVPAELLRFPRRIPTVRTRARRPTSASRECETARGTTRSPTTG